MAEVEFQPCPPTRGHLARGDIVGGHDLGIEECYWHLEVEVRSVAKHSVMSRLVSTVKTSQAQMVSGAKVEKCCLNCLS